MASIKGSICHGWSIGVIGATGATGASSADEFTWETYEPRKKTSYFPLYSLVFQIPSEQVFEPPNTSWAGL